MEGRLTTVLAADVVGYSRLRSGDEAGTLAALKALRRDLVKPKEIQYRGRTVKLMGDGAVMEFARVVDAVAFAVDVQLAMAERNRQVPEERHIVYRIGLAIGDIVAEGDDISGEGVRVAARVEGLCEPGGVCLSDTVFDQVKGRLDLTFEPLGGAADSSTDQSPTAYRVVLDEKAMALEAPVVQGAATDGRRRWPAVAAAFAAGLIAMAGLVWWQPWAPDLTPASVARMAFPLPDKPSIAVLPFANLSQDPSQDYVADGVTEDIIARLSKIPNLFVIARDSVYAYKARRVTVQRVAEELGVRYVLEGSALAADDRVHITARFVDATAGDELWTERYDRAAEDVFALLQEITLAVAGALQVELTEADRDRLRLGRGTVNLAAWANAVRALKVFRRYTKGDVAQARRMFESAVELDPGYAAAWSFLGWTHWQEARWARGEPAGGSLEKAAELGRKALAIDDSLPTTYSLLGSISLIKGEYDQAVAYHEKAVALQPSGADGTAMLASALTYTGRPAEAVPLLEKAMRLSPYYPPWYLSTLGSAYRLAGRYDEAIAALERAEARNPENLDTQALLAVTYSEMGRREDARAKSADILRIDPEFTIGAFAKAIPYKDPAEIVRITDALRDAGLPD